uniref:Uncharacterized protein n=1 Tax=Salix viminalis TaxID=40686 RepID=A0A6N2N4A0_SALVM
MKDLQPQGSSSHAKKDTHLIILEHEVVIEGIHLGNKRKSDKKLEEEFNHEDVYTTHQSKDYPLSKHVLNTCIPKDYITTKMTLDNY